VSSTCPPRRFLKDSIVKHRTALQTEESLLIAHGTAAEVYTRNQDLRRLHVKAMGGTT
jgi:hypothetical protein